MTVILAAVVVAVLLTGIVVIGVLGLIIVMIRTAAAQRARGHGSSESMHWMRWIEGLVSGRPRRRR